MFPLSDLLVTGLKGTDDLQTPADSVYFVPGHDYFLIKTFSIYYLSVFLNTAFAVTLGSSTVLSVRRGLHQTSKALAMKCARLCKVKTQFQ